MPHRKRLALVLALLVALLAVPATAFARGGTGGGGGGGTSFAAINRVSAAVTCDGPTTMSITLDKGFDKRIEAQVAAFGAPNADGTTSLGGGWSLRLWNDTTGTSLGGWGTTLGASTPSVLWTSLMGGVTAGSYQLTFTAIKTAAGAPLALLDPTAVALESCSATLFVTAR